jgi:hypothetical protein
MTKKPTKKMQEANASAKEVTPMMTSYAADEGSSSPSRRNLSGVIERTERFHNIDYGLVPFKYSHNTSNKSSLNIRDAIILCQKAYYNFSVFRNVIDLMTEFSCSNLYFTGGNKKSREFFEAFFKKINLENFLDKFFREYYRSGNVFIYRFDYTLKPEDVLKITQTFGGGVSEAASSAGVVLPAKYMILNPADIQYGGNISFVGGKYYKILTDYELERLRNPTTDEDRAVLKSLDEQNKLKLKKKTYSGAGAFVSLPLDVDRVNAVFYKKQDYEPFSVPMGFPVLEDINWKQEMKKMDMALTRTTQQAVLLITMGSELKNGTLNINQKNIEAMQGLFQNQSVGKVLVSDFTTKAEFIIPDIGAILDPKKYQIVNEDIQLGLNNILVGDEKFSSTNAKVNIFMERLNQGRKALVTDFLLPEIKRLSQNMGFKNFPTPHFEEMDFKDTSVWNRVCAQLVQIGVLTPSEGITAINTGVLPDEEHSVESQREFLEYKNEGLYAPIASGPGAGVAPINTGRPVGSKAPQSTKTPSPAGGGKKTPAIASYSIKGVSEAFREFEKLQAKVEDFLKKKHKKKTLTPEQLEVVEAMAKDIFTNEEKDKWISSIKEYSSGSAKPNEDRISKLKEISEEHGIDLFHASVLNFSQI